MTINIPTGYAQVTISYYGPTITGRAATVLGYSLGEEGTLDGCVDGVEAAYIANLAAFLHVDFGVDNIRAVDNTNIAEKVTSIDGQRTGTLAPPQCSLLVKKTTNLRGRQYRGRNYWPGLMNDDNIRDDGTLIPGFVDTMTDAFAGFNGDLSLLGYFPVILHNDAGLTPTAITGGGVESRIATQRRRLR